MPRQFLIEAGGNDVSLLPIHAIPNSTRKVHSMRLSSHTLFALASGVVLGLLPLPRASADDSGKPSTKPRRLRLAKKADQGSNQGRKSCGEARSRHSRTNLLDAIRDGLVAVDAEGKGTAG